jgi:hypothetical protein
MRVLESGEGERALLPPSVHLTRLPRRLGFVQEFGKCNTTMLERTILAYQSPREEPCIPFALEWATRTESEG